MKRKGSSDFEKGSEIAKQVTSLMSDVDLKNNGADCDALKEWILFDKSSKEVLDKFKSEHEFERMCSDFVRQDRDAEYRNFVEILMARKWKRRAFRRRIITQISVASAVIALSFLIYKVNKSDVNIIPNEIPKNEIIVPVLITQNGDTHKLVGQNEMVRLDSSIVINGKNEIVYNHTGEISSGRTEYNTLIIPYKYTFKVNLSDGTEVLLNANSELTYPTKFIEGERRVFLKGEAFFSVAKDEKPFIVQTNEIDFRVYGTKFNVNLNEKNKVAAILVEGSVGITMKNVSGSSEVIITPDQLFTLDVNTGESVVRNINVDAYLGWMDGSFKFQNQELSSLLEELSMWYGAEFIYDKNRIKDVQLTLNIDREMQLESVLRVLETMTNVKFINEGGGKYSIK